MRKSMNIENIKNAKAFLLILQYNEIAVNPKTLFHRYQCEDEVSEKDIKLICKDLEIKCKCTRIKRKHIEKLPCPFLYRNHEGEYNIVIKADETQVLTLSVDQDQPKLFSMEDFAHVWDGTVFLFKKKVAKGEEKFGFSWFFKTILFYKSALIQVLLAYFIIQIVGLSTPIFIQFILDKVLTTGNMSTLIVLSSLLIFALTFELILTLAKDYVFHFTTNRMDMILNSKLIRHLFSLPLAYFERRRIGDTIARVREIENIRTFLTGTPLMSVLDALFVLIYVVIMFFYSTQLSFIVLAIVPCIVIIYAFATPIFKKRLDEKFYHGAALQSFMVESMNGIHTIKSFALEPKKEREWEELAASFTDVSFRTKKLVYLINDVVSYLQKVQDIVILAVGSYLVIQRSLSVGELVAFRMIASKITSPLLRFVQMWQDYQQMRLSVERVGDIFENPVEYQDRALSGVQLPNLQGNIRFENVGFRYDIRQPLVLHDMSFEISVNQIIGIIGRSGSGKSTLSKLIQRLYIPEQGKIYIDDVDISRADPFWLRQQIGVVLQENFIFSDTVKGNIAINHPTATYEEVERVSKLAGAHEFIVQLDKGYDTLIGEDGMGLSGGQKQRLAIARALLNNPRIMIFDEATSALDYESERIIQENLREICQGRTVIIIAHRLSTLKECDMIMSLDKGNVIEYDKPSSLLQQEHSFYRYLMEQQKGASL